MRVVRDPDEAGSLERLVLTGDGRAERRRLEAIAPKYDHDDVLHCPSSNGGEIRGGARRIVGG